MSVFPKVVDLSHYQNEKMDFHAAYNAGIRGIIHKCTESNTLVDAFYHRRRIESGAANMLWGAYHFIRRFPSMELQAKLFVQHAEPDEHTLMALDHEVRDVSMAMCKEFIQAVEAEIKRDVVLYDGFVVKEMLQHPDAYWSKKRLWLADYRAVPSLPVPWQKTGLWLLQYTGDGSGRTPHSIPGIGNGLDINSYGDGDDRLAKEWAGAPV